MNPIVITFTYSNIFGIVSPFRLIRYFGLFDAIVVIFEEEDYEDAVGICVVVGTHEEVVIGFLCAVRGLEVFCEVLLDYFGFTISTGIIRDALVNREGSFLHREAVHRIYDIGGMIIGHAACADHIFIFLFHYFLILFK